MSVFNKRDFDLFLKAANHFAKLWGLEDSPKFENDSENIVYSFEKDNVILRLTENFHRTKEELSQEFEIIAFFNKYISEVTKAIHSKNGKLIESENFAGFPIHASAFVKANGSWIDDTQTLKGDIPIRLGEIIGNMHYFGKRIKSNRQEYIYNDHLLNFEKYLKDDYALVECKKALDWYASLPKDKDSFGIIHGDVHFGNFFYSNDKEITLFDFDDCSNGFYIFDIGIHLYYALGMFTYKGNKAHYENYKARFLAAYKGKYNLDPRWFQLIDDVLRFRTIDLYTWMNKMYDKNSLSVKQEEMFKIYERRIKESFKLDYKSF